MLSTTILEADERSQNRTERKNHLKWFVFERLSQTIVSDLFNLRPKVNEILMTIKPNYDSQLSNVILMRYGEIGFVLTFSAILMILVGC